MGSTSIFEVPGLSQYNIHGPINSARKRKRRQATAQKDGEIEEADNALAPPDQHSSFSQPIEYTAVLTPAERHQRRIAGQPLNRDPPSLPFPHAAVPESNLARHRNEHISFHETGTKLSSTKPKIHLRGQHLATMTSILHRCLREKDYSRAARALGLLLRSEINGKTTDIRIAGFWGIGAEILMNQSNLIGSRISREGFERARAYYDKLALQYPPSKIWPEAVNAQDFKIAMFGLWVFVTCQESLRMQELSPAESETLSDTVLEAKIWELQQAEQIATQMDQIMAGTPFSDDYAFIRLRGMVALWVADLVEECGTSLTLKDSTESWLRGQVESPQAAGSDTSPIERTDKQSSKAQNARAVAHRMFAKLDGEDLQDDESAELSG